jgi:hypothetical protein
LKKSTNLIIDLSICLVYESPFIEKGICCCNCKHQTVLYKHPWNKNFGKGKCTEVCGYACTVNPDGSMNQKASFSDDKHGLCELHYRRLIPPPVEQNKLVL